MLTSVLPLKSAALMEKPSKSDNLGDGASTARLADHEQEAFHLLQVRIGAPTDGADDAVFHVPLDQLRKRLFVLSADEDRTLAVEGGRGCKLLGHVHQEPVGVSSQELRELPIVPEYRLVPDPQYPRLRQLEAIHVRLLRLLLKDASRPREKLLVRACHSHIEAFLVFQLFEA